MAIAPELRRTLDEYRALLDARFGGRLVSVRLFGSRARGDADRESDADVAVVISELTEDERTAAVDFAYEAWRRAAWTGPLLSPLVWSEAQQQARRRAELRIALDIDREGISV